MAVPDLHSYSSHFSPQPSGSLLLMGAAKPSLRRVPSFAFALQHTDGIIPNTKIAKKLGEILPTMDSEPR